MEQFTHVGKLFAGAGTPVFRSSQSKHLPEFDSSKTVLSAYLWAASVITGTLLRDAAGDEIVTRSE